MTVVYIDMLFLLNWIANYLLLLAGGRMAGAVLRRGRIALAGAAGALYAAALFLPKTQWLAEWPCKLAAGVAMALIAFGSGRQFFRAAAMFFGASFALAGLVLAAELLIKTPLTMKNGVFYSQFDLRLLLLLFVMCYFLLSLIFRRIGAHSVRELVRAEVSLRQKTVSLTLLVDTGNTLTDPATNRPVLIAAYDAVSHMLPCEIDPAKPVESMTQLNEAGMKGRLLTFCTVGTECGLLLAVRTDAVRLNGREMGALLLALSPGPISDGGGYQGLIGGI